MSLFKRQEPRSPFGEGMRHPEIKPRQRAPSIEKKEDEVVVLDSSRWDDISGPSELEHLGFVLASVKGANKHTEMQRRNSYTVFAKGHIFLEDPSVHAFHERFPEMVKVQYSRTGHIYYFRILLRGLDGAWRQDGRVRGPFEVNQL